LGRRRGWEEGEGGKKKWVERRRGEEEGEGGKKERVGRKSGWKKELQYKERTGKERGREEGNEERKGRCAACMIGEYENGKSG
jgi:hypothetical protein